MDQNRTHTPFHSQTKLKTTIFFNLKLGEIPCTSRYCLKTLLSVAKRVHFIKRICLSIYQRVKGLKDILNMLHDKKNLLVMPCCYALPLNCIPSALDIAKHLVLNTLLIINWTIWSVVGNV